MNKLIAFVGGIAAGVIYSDEIKQAYKLVKQKKADALAKEIENEVERKLKATHLDEDLF
jgi:ribosomal protein L31E